MRKSVLFKSLLALALVLISGSVWAAADVTYDFTGSEWTVSDGTLSDGTVNFTGAGSDNFKMNTGYFIMGKANAYLNFPTYDQAVEKIVITGRNGASASVKQNIYVGDTEVSTVTTGATGVNTYLIASDYQEAGTQYTLKVTSSHNTQITKIEIYYVGSGTDPITTYTVTYDANGGTGTMTDSNSPYNANATVTVLANSFTRDGYTFVKWNTAANGSGTGYAAGETFTINANTTLYAQWEEQTSGNEKKLTFDLSSNPGEWPTTASTTSANYTYTLNSVDYTFALKNIKCNSGYLMMYATAALGLPAIEGYKLTKVVASNSGGCSTSTKVGISSSETEESYIDGGAIQTWSSTSSQYTYTLTSTQPNTVYYLYVTIKNAQVVTLDLYYDTDDSTPAPSITISDNEEIAYNATSGSFKFTVNNEVEGGTIAVSENEEWISNAAISGNSVTFTTTANEANTARNGIITLTYTYNATETVKKDVSVSQEANPGALLTIAAVRAQGTGAVMTKGIVTSVSGKTAYIQDETAAVVVYGSSNLTCVVGDEISVKGTLSTYSGLLEITNPTIEVLASGNTVNPVEKTIEEINTDFSASNTLQGMLVKIVEATVTAISEDGKNTTIAQGENSIAVRGIKEDEMPAVGDVVTLVANIGCYNVPQMANPTNVVKKEGATPSITVNPTSVEVDADEHLLELGVVLKNIDLDGGVTVLFYDAKGETEKDYDWITGDYSKESGKAEILVGANTGDARTAYLKVVGFDADAELIYSDLVTITQDKPVIDYATLPFEFDGKVADVATTDGLTQSGLGKDYASAPYLKFDTSEDNLVLKINEAPNVLSFDVKANASGSDPWSGTFTVETSADGVDYETLATYTDLSTNIDTKIFHLNSTVRYIKWTYTEKVSGNVGLGNIKVSATPLTFTKVVTAYKFATLYLPFAAKAPAGVEVYTANVEDGAEVATLTKVEDGIVPAKTGVVLYADVNAETRFTFTETSETSTADFSKNLLKGVVGKTQFKSVDGYDAANNYYALAEVENELKFCLVSGGSFAANTAYLELPASGGDASQTLGLRFGDATMVEAIETSAEQSVIYDLTGRRVEKATKGLYIVNGKKVFMK